jgi:hypothetical protein
VFLRSKYGTLQILSLAEKSNRKIKVDLFVTYLRPENYV